MTPGAMRRRGSATVVSVDGRRAPAGGPVIQRRKPLLPSRKQIARRTRPRSKGGRRFTHASRDPAKLAWVWRNPCAIQPTQLTPNCVVFMAMSDPHHEPPLSRGGTDDGVVALCWRHHGERHSLGKREFERRYRVDLTALAVDTEARYQAWRAARAGTGT